MRRAYEAAFVLLLAVSGAGCTSVGYFKDSTASKVATLEVVMTETPHSFWIYRNGMDCSGGFDVLSKETTASIVAGTGRPLVVEAEKELALGFDGRHESPLAYCDLVVSFFPEPAGRYRIRPYKTASGCGLGVSRLLDEGGGVREIPEPSLKRRLRRQGATGLVCVPL